MVFIIIFAVIAGFLLWKLKSILGREDENAMSNNRASKGMKDITSQGKAESMKEASFNLNFLESKKEAKENKKMEIEEGLAKNIALLNPEFENSYRSIASTFESGVFDIKGFMEGVEVVTIELINSMGGDQNLESLSRLASQELILKLQQLLIEKSKNFPGQCTKLAKIENIEFVSMENTMGVNIVKVKVKSEQIKFVKENDIVTSGSVTVPVKFIDILEFQRNTKLQSSWVLTNIE